ncbi:MAG TPA: hypothetical protein VJ824_04605 [Bacillota bacterium]|nr:hypothetical protein [Bacillota bacterium]
MLRRKNPLQKNKLPIQWLFIASTVFILLYFIIQQFPPIYHTPHSTTPSTPTALVQQFYEYERIGDYGSSWELFHSQMKDRFNKQNYIQQRAKVFMQDFGVDTFEFSIGKAQPVHSWKMTPDTAPLEETYRVPVTQMFKSNFGVFSLQQDVYVADDNGKLRVLWAY